MVDRVRIRPAVLVSLEESRSFLEHYFNQGGIGGIFVDGNLKLASAEEVERQITTPLEVALAGMPGLEMTRSKSFSKSPKSPDSRKRTILLTFPGEVKKASTPA